MTNKPASPFAGLDTSLLRETQADGGADAPTGPTRRRGRQPGAAESVPVPAIMTDPIAASRQALKTIGKEIYYLRITPAEKQHLSEVIHALSERGIRTSATEVGRIALNSLLAEYAAHGDDSVLVRVLTTD
jgi:hypothetical protein